MTARPSTTPEPDRCEVCRARLGDDRPRADRRRCADHVDQQALFPLTFLPRRRTRRGTDRITDTSGDRHHQRARRARSRKDT